MYFACSDYNHTWYGVGEYYSGTMNTTTTNVYWLLNFHTNILSSFSEYFFVYTDKCKLMLIPHSIHSYIICADGG